MYNREEKGFKQLGKKWATLGHWAQRRKTVDARKLGEGLTHNKNLIRIFCCGGCKIYGTQNVPFKPFLGVKFSGISYSQCCGTTTTIYFQKLLIAPNRNSVPFKQYTPPFRSR